MKIDGEFLTNRRFADEIFLCTRRMGLKMNIAKSNVMVVDNTPIDVNNVPIENVEGIVYFGTTIQPQGK